MEKIKIALQSLLNEGYSISEIIEMHCAEGKWDNDYGKDSLNNLTTEEIATILITEFK